MGILSTMELMAYQNSVFECESITERTNCERLCIPIQ